MERYTYISTISSGAYGVVYQCLDSETGSYVAAKGIKTAHEDSTVMRLTIREVKVLKLLPPHVNVVRLLEAFRSQSGRVYLVFEYVERSLYQEMDRHPGGSLPAPMVKSVAWQLLHALGHCHAHKVVHRDVKPANILLTGYTPGVGSGGVAKLCDFGFARLVRGAGGEGARAGLAGGGGGGGGDVGGGGGGGGRGALHGVLDEGARLSSYVMTRWYRPPEVLVGESYGTPIDIWSYGCTLAELATGRPLFPGTSTPDQLWRIMRCLGSLPPPHMTRMMLDRRLQAVASPPPRSRTLRQRLPELDSSLVDLIAACLTLDPRRRPTVHQLLQMPYFWDIPRLLAGTDLAKQLPYAAAAFASSGAVAASAAVAPAEAKAPLQPQATHQNLAGLNNGGAVLPAHAATPMQRPGAGCSGGGPFSDPEGVVALPRSASANATPVSLPPGAPAPDAQVAAAAAQNPPEVAAPAPRPAHPPPPTQVHESEHESEHASEARTPSAAAAIPLTSTGRAVAGALACASYRDGAAAAAPRTASKVACQGGTGNPSVAALGTAATATAAAAARTAPQPESPEHSKEAGDPDSIKLAKVAAPSLPPQLATPTLVASSVARRLALTAAVPAASGGSSCSEGNARGPCSCSGAHASGAGSLASSGGSSGRGSGSYHKREPAAPLSLAEMLIRTAGGAGDACIGSTNGRSSRGRSGSPAAASAAGAVAGAVPGGAPRTGASAAGNVALPLPQPPRQSMGFEAEAPRCVFGAAGAGSPFTVAAAEAAEVGVATLELRALSSLASDTGSATAVAAADVPPQLSGRRAPAAGVPPACLAQLSCPEAEGQCQLKEDPGALLASISDASEVMASTQGTAAEAAAVAGEAAPAATPITAASGHRMPSQGKRGTLHSVEGTESEPCETTPDYVAFVQQAQADAGGVEHTDVTPRRPNTVSQVFVAASSCTGGSGGRDCTSSRRGSSMSQVQAVTMRTPPPPVPLLATVGPLPQPSLPASHTPPASRGSLGQFVGRMRSYILSGRHSHGGHRNGHARDNEHHPRGSRADSGSLTACGSRGLHVFPGPEARPTYYLARPSAPGVAGTNKDTTAPSAPSSLYGLPDMQSPLGVPLTSLWSPLDTGAPRARPPPPPLHRMPPGVAPPVPQSPLTPSLGALSVGGSPWLLSTTCTAAPSPAAGSPLHAPSFGAEPDPSAACAAAANADLCSCDRPQKCEQQLLRGATLPSDHDTDNDDGDVATDCNGDGAGYQHTSRWMLRHGSEGGPFPLMLSPQGAQVLVSAAPVVAALLPPPTGLAAASNATVQVAPAGPSASTRLTAELRQHQTQQQQQYALKRQQKQGHGAPLPPLGNTASHPAPAAPLVAHGGSACGPSRFGSGTPPPHDSVVRNAGAHHATAAAGQGCGPGMCSIGGSGDNPEQCRVGAPMAPGSAESTAPPLWLPELQRSGPGPGPRRSAAGVGLGGDDGCSGGVAPCRTDPAVRGLGLPAMGSTAAAAAAAAASAVPAAYCHSRSRLSHGSHRHPHVGCFPDGLATSVNGSDDCSGGNSSGAGRPRPPSQLHLPHVSPMPAYGGNGGSGGEGYAGEGGGGNHGAGSPARQRDTSGNQGGAPLTFALAPGSSMVVCPVANNSCTPINSQVSSSLLDLSTTVTDAAPALGSSAASPRALLRGVLGYDMPGVGGGCSPFVPQMRGMAHGSVTHGSAAASPILELETEEESSTHHCSGRIRHGAPWALVDLSGPAAAAAEAAHECAGASSPRPSAVTGTPRTTGTGTEVTADSGGGRGSGSERLSGSTGRCGEGAGTVLSVTPKSLGKALGRRIKAIKAQLWSLSERIGRN